MSDDHYHHGCPFCSTFRTRTIFFPTDEFLPIEVQAEQARHIVAEHADQVPTEELELIASAGSLEQFYAIIHTANRTMFGTDLIPVARIRGGNN